MKKNYGKFVMVGLILLLCLSLFSGCGKKEDSEGQVGTKNNQLVSASPESTAVEEATPTPAEPVSTTAATATADQKDTQLKQLPIYTINDESLECEAGVALIPEASEITAELIVHTVVENLAEHSLTVGVDSVTVDKDRVIVSFLAGTAPLTTVGSGVEATILDCISGSLLDNLDSCKEVIFRAEGKSYESGHIALGFDEAYAWE